VLAKRVIVQMYIEIHTEVTVETFLGLFYTNTGSLKEMHLTYAHAPNLCKNQSQTLLQKNFLELTTVTVSVVWETTGLESKQESRECFQRCVQTLDTRCFRC